jgi:hypothetical protein
MTVADITLAAFTLCNSVRVVAYVPQIAKAAVDSGGAQAISFTTWSIFLLSNVSAIAYALVNQNDWAMASMFLANAVCCGAILALGAWKRSQHRQQTSGCGLVGRGETSASIPADIPVNIPAPGGRRDQPVYDFCLP